MLFNTPEFIFLFLPAAVVLHFALARWSVDAAVIGTTFSSLVFYAWWNPPFVILPAASIALNFWLAARMVAAEPLAARALLIAGIVGNLLVLGYFKYADFLLSIVDGHKAVPPKVPLALSFTTFVQLAFLVETYRRRTVPVFARYALFVAFFPHLIAGPIVRWSNLGRQLNDRSRFRLDWANVALGLTIFTFGLVKKVLLADTLSPYVTAVFDTAARGEPVPGAAAWGACLAFTGQIYFDFSGYSDMAVGLGLLFNLRLPINFAAPLRATSMVDFWRRWHITLSQWFRDFIYAPLTFGRRGVLRQAVSIMITMALAGFWHGAGWTFIAWGAWLGLLMLINIAWQRLLRPDWQLPGFVGWALTFTGCVIGAVFFRAADIETSWHLLEAMAGFGDAMVPPQRLVDWDDWLIQHGYVSDLFVRTWLGTTWSVTGTAWTVLALAVALIVPDTMEITRYREGEAQSHWRRPVGLLAWRPSLLALGVTAALFAAVFTSIGRVSEFLYYQF